MAEEPLALRASDRDRERVVDLLRRHAADGRLTVEELDERATVALSARTVADLEALLRDLPAFDPEAPVAAAAADRRPSRWTVAIMGGATRSGRWRPAPRSTALAVMGGCKIDLRHVDPPGAEIFVRAIAVMGGIEVLVPDGWEVELSGIALMGGKEAKLRDAPPRPDAPVVRVRAYALMGGVEVKSKARDERWREVAETLAGRLGGGSERRLREGRRDLR